MNRSSNNELIFVLSVKPYSLRSKVEKWLRLTGVFILLAGFGCSENPQIEGFDPAAWKRDTNGCQGDRIRLEESLWSGRDQLIDYSESQVSMFLGKPNRTELYVRNQKFFVYFIGPSEDCRKGTASPRSLVIRFNALNYSNEISIRN